MPNFVDVVKLKMGDEFLDVGLMMMTHDEGRCA